MPSPALAPAYPVDQDFTTIEAAITACENVAQSMDCVLTKRRTRVKGGQSTVTLVCDRSGAYTYESQGIRMSTTRHTECPFTLTVRSYAAGYSRAYINNGMHNHELSTDETAKPDVTAHPYA